MYDALLCLHPSECSAPHVHELQNDLSDHQRDRPAHPDIGVGTISFGQPVHHREEVIEGAKRDECKRDHVAANHPLLVDGNLPFAHCVVSHQRGGSPCKCQASQAKTPGLPKGRPNGVPECSRAAAQDCDNVDASGHPLQLKVPLAEAPRKLPGSGQKRHHPTGDMEKQPAAHLPVVGGPACRVCERSFVVVQVVAEHLPEHEPGGDEQDDGNRQRFRPSSRTG